MAGNGANNPSAGLVSNSHWNLVAFGANLIAQFVTVPFILRWIGLDDFGMAAVVLAVCAPMSLVGAVLGQALIREISSRCATDHRVLSACTTAAMRMCLLACIVYWLALVVIGPTIARPLIRVASSVSALWPALVIAASGSIAQQVALVLQSVSAARQDYRTIARVTLFTTMASSVTTLGFTWISPDMKGYLVGVSAGFLLVMLAWLHRWWDVIEWKHVFAIQKLKETGALMRFGKWQGVAQLAGVLGNQIDRYALGAMTPISVVGQYTVANRLQEAAYIGVIKAGEVLFPRFGAIASQDIAGRLEFFQAASWAVGMLSAIILVPMAILSTCVLTLWVGPAATTGADHMLFVLVLAGIIGSSSNVFTYYAMGIGRNAAVAGISVLFSMLTVMMTIALIAIYGSAAAGMGLLVASIVRVVASMSLTRRLFFPDVGRSELFISTALPMLVGVSIALGGQHIVTTRPDGWIGLAVYYLLLSLFVLAIGVLTTAMTQPGRKIVIRLAQSFIWLWCRQ